ncbi:alanine racemase [Candidatus Campbellbacteria bacterium CG10_big_fil_rev_8_21_14_0_10_35_52]|uniref:Alanine racemase n=1 Tax=Candidatus Campbellbacteria bacterium CG10_big_fil_rev_8_21_14_0_10_35_52 TaxID=1974527 RepID=A0A2M6WV50_9BACT|nr:MAG: alanine racemase [Candidatus Campbellbacteria bacterium CG10_big_fil_rev_8_21_14_0_10_35_52]
MKPNLKTWIEIDRKAALSNVKAIRSILKKKTRLYAVVKSNAYGHGLREFSLIVNGKVDGFCVDSTREGKTLRDVGIKKHILILGPTLSNKEVKLAAENNLEITISTFESLKQISAIKEKPFFQIKVDTGMHRQGFFVKDLQKVIDIIKNGNLSGKLKGVYTHFASAKDVTYPYYTKNQIEKFKEVQIMFKKSGFNNVIFHSSATGGTILYPQSHFDMVRIGIGLYGYFPSKESKIQHSLINKKTLHLKTVLSWKTKISEIKKLKKGDFVGYDLTEKIDNDTFVAIIPIGYWHGFSRALSHKGQVLIKGKKCKVVGRVSMDIIIINCGNINTKVGDIVTIIGKSGKKIFTADDQMDIADTIIYTYEIITTINPLIKRIVI